MVLVRIDCENFLECIFISFSRDIGSSQDFLDTRILMGFYSFVEFRVNRVDVSLRSGTDVLACR